MQCKCGGETTYHEHEVKGLKKAREWYPSVQPYHLPIIVCRDVCSDCGRQMKRPMKLTPPHE